MDLTPIPTGNDVRVNTFTIGQQIFPAVAALTGGGFVVTWSSDGQDGSFYGIYGQRYAPDGTALGSEFRVNTFTFGHQLYSSVAALAGGGFVVTWSSSGQEGGWGTYGQRYAADGTPLGSEFRVNTFVGGDQLASSVTALAGGGFVVAWMAGGSSFLGQRYAADGTPLGSEFRVDTFTGEALPSVTALAGGGFVVTWMSRHQDRSDYDVYAQRYAADGTPLGSEFRVNTYTTFDQLYPAVTALAGGGFVVTWSSYGQQDASHPGIYGQRYAADGTPLGSEFHVNTAAGEQFLPSVTALAGGGFVVTWSSYGQDGSVWGIYGQRYAADGTAAGTEFRINQITAGDQFANTFYGSETVATLADGRLVQVWAGTGAEEVFFRLIHVPSIVLDDTATSIEDTPVNIQVLANDTSAITGTTNGAHGTVTINNNGTPGNTADDFVVYTPVADFNGTDTFTYTGGVTETATVTVTVTPVADIVNDTATTNEDKPVNILVQGNDNFDSSGHQTTAVTNGAHGTTAVNNNGTAGNTADDFVVYTPTADFNGTDSFTYTVTSGGVTETATVSLTVNAIADIVADAATTNEDTSVNILVLANDTFESTPAITGTTDGAHGTVAVNNNGTPGNTADDFIVYTPTPDFNGTEAFTYTVTSGGDTETGTVTVTVNPVTDINGDTATSNEDTAVNIPVLANDSFGTPQITGTTNGAHGTATSNDNGTPGNMADDFVVFTPAPDFNGTDTFTYTVTSGGLTETASVSVTVTPAADIVNDSVTIAQDSGAHNLDLLANDTFENPGRSITSVGAAAHGTTSINNNGTAGNTADDFVVYTSAAGYSGPDTFTYTVTSGGVAETATVSVTVTAPPPPPSTTPTSGNDDITGTEGPDTIVALAGDDIIDGRGAGDLLLGNLGNDTVFGRTGNDTIWGGQGNDSLDGAEDNDFMWGNEGADTIVGGDGANTIVGGQDSADAADSITAGSGPDLILGNGGADTITADGGGNTVIGGFGSDSIVTGADNDLIFGNQDNDAINGSEGANLIFGGFGDDSILTGSGNDTIWGNEGNDTIAGGAGADRYVFLIGSGNDQINGFSGSAEGDRLDLQGQTFTTGASADGDVLLTLFGGGTVELNGITPAGFSPTFVL